MKTRHFRELLEARWDQGRFVCVGLDSDSGKIPRSLHTYSPQRRPQVLEFNQRIVAATQDLVCAYKPNIAFYEDLGGSGLFALRDTIQYIHTVAPQVPVILDAKRGDTRDTNIAYARMAFDYLGADAITVHPYLGAEALQPFLALESKGVIVLCRTSNPGAGEFQDLMVTPSREEADRWELPLLGKIAPEPTQMPLYQYVAYRVSREWNQHSNCGLVVGATYPEELRQVREIVDSASPDSMPILMPGVGFQQKDVPLEEQVNQVVTAGRDRYNRGMTINSSRGIIFASSGPDFADAARRETQKLNDLIRRYL